MTIVEEVALLRSGNESLRSGNLKLIEENKKLKEENLIIACAYCGYKVSRNLDWAQAIANHISECAKHPLTQAIKVNDQLLNENKRLISCVHSLLPVFDAARRISETLNEFDGDYKVVDQELWDDLWKKVDSVILNEVPK
jgi:hypothetical protein